MRDGTDGGIRVARLVDEAVAEKQQVYVTRIPPTPRSVLRLDRAHSAQSISWTRTDRNTSTSLVRSTGTALVAASLQVLVTVQ